MTARLHHKPSGRAGLEDMFRDYVALLPRYRGVPDLRGVALQRAFFGFVPNWCGPAAAAAAPAPTTHAHQPVQVCWVAACSSLP